MLTRVSWYRSAQARYLLARHYANGIALTLEERLTLLEITLAGRECRMLPTATIQRLTRLIKRKAPTQARRLNAALSGKTPL